MGGIEGKVGPPGLQHGEEANRQLERELRQQAHWDVRADHMWGANDNTFFRYSKQDEAVGASLRFPSALDGDGTQFDHVGAQAPAVGLRGL